MWGRGGLCRDSVVGFLFPSFDDMVFQASGRRPILAAILKLKMVSETSCKSNNWRDYSPP